MVKGRRRPLSEEEVIKKIREEYPREKCIQFWYELREGSRRMFPRHFRHKHAHRKYVIEAFVEEFREKNKLPQKPSLEDVINGEDQCSFYPQQPDFSKNKLSGLLQFYDGSPYDAFVDVGFTNPESENYDTILDKTPWLVMEKMPNKYWKIKKNRIKATKWLVKILSKPITEIRKEDFKKYNLIGLLNIRKGSPYAILKEVYPKLKRTELHKLPDRYWHKKQNRIKHTKELVQKLNKPMTQIKVEDFRDNDLGTLIKLKNNSVFEALKEAYPELKETDMYHVPQRFWKDERNFRKEVIRIIKNNNGKLPSYGELDIRIQNAIRKYHGGISAVRRKYERLACKVTGS